MTLHSSESLQNLVRGLDSNYPLFFLLGWDEVRIRNLLTEAAKAHFGEEGKMYTWTTTAGFDFEEGSDGVTTDPVRALKRIADSGEPGMYLMKDLPAEFSVRPELIRAARDAYYNLKDRNIYVFLSYPILLIPDELKKEIFLVEMNLPAETEILEFLEKRQEAQPNGQNLAHDILYRVASAMRGLSLSEVGHVHARLQKAGFADQTHALLEIQEEKSQMLRKESCLRFYPPQSSLDLIGGLDNLKDWVIKRKDLYSEKAIRAGIPLPSGILFMGVSGCGKSMAAKAIAAAWELPLVRLDMSLVLSGSFGSPEIAFENATRLAEEVAPIVLWIDEIENALGYDRRGGKSGNVNIFSSFLTWLQEKSPRIFLAATANRIEELPAEVLRKGRFDQLFFLDLPNKDERMAIFGIHIGLQGGDTKTFNLSYLATATKDWSGAEIEQAVKSARIDAYQENRPFNEDDIVRSAANMVPLSETMTEQIVAIKDWSFKRAVPASKS